MKNCWQNPMHSDEILNELPLPHICLEKKPFFHQTTLLDFVFPHWRYEIFLLDKLKYFQMSFCRICIIFTSWLRKIFKTIHHVSAYEFKWVCWTFSWLRKSFFVVVASYCTKSGCFETIKVKRTGKGSRTGIKSTSDYLDAYKPRPNQNPEHTNSEPILITPKQIWVCEKFVFPSKTHKQRQNVTLTYN